MSLTDPQSRINTVHAQLASKLSGKPAHVHHNIFVWNDVIMTRSLAVILLLKVNNNIPVGKLVRDKLYSEYTKKFKNHPLQYNSDQAEDQNEPYTSWFHGILNKVYGIDSTTPVKKPAKWDIGTVKQILTMLHS